MSKISESSVKAAQEKFGALIENESARIEKMKQGSMPTDFSKKEKFIMGVLPGDGVGPILMEQAMRVLGELVGKEIAEKTMK